MIINNFTAFLLPYLAHPFEYMVAFNRLPSWEREWSEAGLGDFNSDPENIIFYLSDRLKREFKSLGEDKQNEAYIQWCARANLALQKITAGCQSVEKLEVVISYNMITGKCDNYTLNVTYAGKSVTYQYNIKPHKEIGFSGLGVGSVVECLMWMNIALVTALGFYLIFNTAPITGFAFLMTAVFPLLMVLSYVNKRLIDSLEHNLKWDDRRIQIDKQKELFFTKKSLFPKKINFLIFPFKMIFHVPLFILLFTSYIGSVFIRKLSGNIEPFVRRLFFSLMAIPVLVLSFVVYLCEIVFSLFHNASVYLFYPKNNKQSFKYKWLKFPLPLIRILLFFPFNLIFGEGIAPEPDLDLPYKIHKSAVKTDRENHISKEEMSSILQKLLLWDFYIKEEGELRKMLVYKPRFPVFSMSTDYVSSKGDEKYEVSSSESEIHVPKRIAPMKKISQWFDSFSLRSMLRIKSISTFFTMYAISFSILQMIHTEILAWQIVFLLLPAIISVAHLLYAGNIILNQLKKYFKSDHDGSNLGQTSKLQFYWNRLKSILTVLFFLPHDIDNSDLQDNVANLASKKKNS